MTSWEGRPGPWRLGSWWPPDPVRVADALQTLKTAAAGLVAWVVATDVLHLGQAFLAPWAAVLVVHSTVYRTFSRAGQQVAATFLGVLLAWTAGQVFGIGAVAMGTMLVVALMLGRIRWWREEGTSIGTTGIVVLATNAVVQDNLLVGRLVDSTVGIVTGLLVNLVVWPPLRDRAAWSRVDELPLDVARLLGEMADGLRPDITLEETEAWAVEQRRIDVRVDEAWRLLYQAEESARFNPRRTAPTRLHEMRDALHLVEQAVADQLSMIRTIATSAATRTDWEEQFRSDWTRLLQATATCAQQHDEEGLRTVQEELVQLVEKFSADDLEQRAWHEYGGMLVTLRNVVGALADVTAWGNRTGPSERRAARYRVPAGRLSPGALGYPAVRRHRRTR